MTDLPTLVVTIAYAAACLSALCAAIGFTRHRRLLATGKEEKLKDLNYYKEQLATNREENSRLGSKLKQVETKLESLECSIDEIRIAMQKQYSKFEEGLGEFHSHSAALFADRDNILKDLELVWKAIHRQHRSISPEITAKKVDEFKKQLEEGTA